MKKLILCLFAIFFLWLDAGLAVADEITNGDVVVLYDNDVHGHMVGYAKIAALKKEMLRKTPYVNDVSLGDFAQGSALVSVSHGQYAIDVMNKIGYDYITLGNHEFDYGLEQLQQMVSSSTAHTLLCNFTDLRTNKRVFPAYAVRQLGDLTIGYIGITTPVTKTSDSPEIYIDSLGNDIFTFHRDEIYELVQSYIDTVRSLGANFVILVSHLGDNPVTIQTSEETIRHTRGLNVILDGHAHHVIPSRIIQDADNHPVLLSSTGAHFLNIGRLVIKPDGSCSSELIPVSQYPYEDKSVNQLINTFEETFDRLPTIANSKYDLAGFDRLHDTYYRNCQTNLGTLSSEAFRAMTQADIGWLNAGGIRNSIPAGKITFKELLSAFPFGNRVCVAEFTGKRILDALEFGVCVAPADNASYPQVSGLKFDLDLSVTANIIMEESGENFERIGEGPRRVSNVQVWSRTNKQWEPLDLEKTYSVASIDFILLKKGCYGMLSNGKILRDDQMLDTQLMENYLTRELHGVIPESYEKPKN